MSGTVIAGGPGWESAHPESSSESAQPPGCRASLSAPLATATPMALAISHLWSSLARGPRCLTLQTYPQQPTCGGQWCAGQHRAVGIISFSLGCSFTSGECNTPFCQKMTLRLKKLLRLARARTCGTDTECKLPHVPAQDVSLHATREECPPTLPPLCPFGPLPLQVQEWLFPGQH